MIETERLILRQPLLDDLDAMQAIYGKAETARYLTGKPSTRAESLTRILRIVGHWQLLGYGVCVAIEKASGTLIGDVGIARYEREMGDHVDLFDEATWTIDSSVQGKGYAVEAMTAYLAWYDAEFGPRRTVCIISIPHERSMQVAEKLGYRPYAEQLFPGTEDDMVTLFERLPP